MFAVLPLLQGKSCNKGGSSAGRSVVGGEGAARCYSIMLTPSALSTKPICILQDGKHKGGVKVGWCLMDLSRDISFL